MKILRDYEGRAIRLTDERLAHILDHPEMTNLEAEIGNTLATPQCVMQSASDGETWLYYRFHRETRVGDKFLCVVVKKPLDDAFVITAYLTDKVKRGRQLWPIND